MSKRQKKYPIQVVVGNRFELQGEFYYSKDEKEDEHDLRCLATIIVRACFAIVYAEKLDDLKPAQYQAFKRAAKKRWGSR